MALTATWQTADSSPVRPTVDDEREHVGFYLTRVLYRIMPALYETLEHAIAETYGAGLPVPRLLRFGTWVGGDMDGNPNVDARTISATLDAQRRAVLERYLDELWQLASLLSQSTTLVDVSAALVQRLEHYRGLLPEAAAQSRPRHADMPYRLFNDLMRARLEATLDDEAGSYASPEEFAEDVQLILDSLQANRGMHAGWFAVRRLLWRVRSFGFHLARLDVRQESSVHARAVAAALGREDWEDLDAVERAQVLGPYASGSEALPASDDESNPRLDAVFAALADARQRHGSDAVGSYIISMAHDRADVLTVLALARRGGLVDADAVPLDIVPLFETVDDLRGGTETLRDLLADSVYRQHLRARGDVQMVMLGYSDSGKDGGIAASRWGLQRAQVELLELAAEAGIRLTFFHGRGGSIIRGGGKTSRALEAAPRGSVDGRLRVTEQGEVIHRKYGIRALALRSLEQMTGAVLQYSLRPRAPESREPQWRQVMDTVAEASSRAYRGFVGERDFMQYFRLATPIDVIERMTLGSRPSRRLGRMRPWPTCGRFPGYSPGARHVRWCQVGMASAAGCRPRSMPDTRRRCARWPPIGRSSAPSSTMWRWCCPRAISISPSCSRACPGAARTLLPTHRRRAGADQALGEVADRAAVAVAARPAPGLVDSPAQSVRRSDQRVAGGPAPALARDRRRGRGIAAGAGGLRQWRFARRPEHRLSQRGVVEKARPPEGGLATFPDGIAYFSLASARSASALSVFSHENAVAATCLPLPSV